MQKTRVEKEKQGKLLSVLAALDAQARQGVLEGARYRIRRPRVRQANREVALPTLAKLQAQDLLDEQMRHRMVLGVSTRNYKQVIGGYTEKLGVARSSVSRAFVRASQKDLDSINEGPLGEYAFVAVMIEGLEIGGRMVVAALGITADMTKIPRGLREGNTENSEVVRDLLASIQERGFTLHCERRLAVIDGAKALKKALRQVFGERVLLQRCWLHKLRNLHAYVPESAYGTLHWRLKKLMALNSLSDARRELAGLSAEAAASLDEGGEDLLTLHRLGITGDLRKSLASTNLIESLFSVVREKIHRVKNWKGRRSHQILRWVAAAISAHRQKMRRVRGMAQAAALIAALGPRSLAARAA